MSRRSRRHGMLKVRNHGAAFVGHHFTIRRLLARHALFALRSSLLVLLFQACRPAYPPPPDTHEGTVVDTLRGVTIPDPYRWLEDQSGTETRAWIDEQNAYAEQIIGEPELRNALRNRLRGLSDAHDIGTPRRGGNWEYFTLRRKGQDLPVIYRRPAPARGTRLRVDPSEDYEMVLEPCEVVLITERYTNRKIYSQSKLRLWSEWHQCSAMLWE